MTTSTCCFTSTPTVFKIFPVQIGLKKLNVVTDFSRLSTVTTSLRGDAAQVRPWKEKQLRAFSFFFLLLYHVTNLSRLLLPKTSSASIEKYSLKKTSITKHPAKDPRQRPRMEAVQIRLSKNRCRVTYSVQFKVPSLPSLSAGVGSHRGAVQPLHCRGSDCRGRQ